MQSFINVVINTMDVIFNWLRSVKIVGDINLFQLFFMYLALGLIMKIFLGVGREED